MVKVLIGGIGFVAGSVAGYFWKQTDPADEVEKATLETEKQKWHDKYLKASEKIDELEIDVKELEELVNEYKENNYDELLEENAKLSDLVNKCDDLADSVEALVKDKKLEASEAIEKIKSAVYNYRKKI